MSLHKRCGDEHKYEMIKLIKPAIFFQVLSRDSVTVSVDAVVYYRVSNPTMVSFFYFDNLIVSNLLKYEDD